MLFPKANVQHSVCISVDTTLIMCSFFIIYIYIYIYESPLMPVKEKNDKTE